MSRYNRVRTLPLILAMVCPLAAIGEIAKTEHVDFPAGGTVTLKNSIGELTIEGWDQPGVEIATVKSPEAVQIAVGRRGNELVIITSFPKHRRLPLSSPFHPA
jgi:hypothetical protein